MTEPEIEVLSLTLPCDRHAAARVRAAFTDLESLGWVLADVILTASELVTNAVRHSGGHPDDEITVRATMLGNLMTISVHDPGRSGHSPGVPVEAPDRTGGRGLRIVQRLAVDWGSERDDGNRVWAQFDLGPPPFARPRPPGI